MADRALATAFVNIVPGTKDFETLLKAQLEGQTAAAGLSTGSAMASSTASSFGSKLKSLIGPALIGAGIAGAYAFTGFVKGSLEAAKEATIADARINQVANSMGLFGKNTESVVARMGDYSSALMKQIGVDDESIKLTQAKLLTFKDLAKTAGTAGGAFDRATQAAYDLASAGFGSAETNAVQLGKALQDPIKGITALARSGVTFTDAEKKRIKSLVESNKIGEAQNLVLKAIETQVGGTAAATATASDKMKVSWGELKETVGAQLAPAFNNLATALIPVIDKLAPVLATAFAGLTPVFNSLAQVLPTLLTALMPLLPIIGELVSIFGELLAAILPPLVKVIQALMPAIKQLVPPILEVLRAFLPLLPVLADLIVALVPIITALLPAFVSIIKILVPVISFLVGVIKAIAIPIIQFLANVIAGIVKWLASAVTWFFNMGKSILEGLGKAGNAIGAWFASLPGTIGKFFANAGTWLLGAGKNIIQGLLDGAGSLLKNIGSFFLKMLPGWIVDPFKAALGIHSPSKVFYEFGKNILDGLKDGLTSDEAGVKDAMKRVSEWVSDALMDKKISAKGAAAAQALVATYSTKLQGLAVEHDKIVKQLSDAQDKLAAKLDEKASFIKSIQDKFGAGNSFSIDDKTTAKSAIESLKARVAKTQELAAVSKQLVAMGLNKDLYKQIVEAGAIDFAKSIIEGGSEAVAQLNVLADQASQQATALATQVGSILFDEGIQFAQGLVDNLTAQESSISGMMGRIADEFGSRIAAIIQAAAAQAQAEQAVSDAKDAAKKAQASYDAAVKKSGAKSKAATTALAALNTAKKAVASATATLNKTQIPAFAAGGFVKQPTVGLIGEAGPEVVTPLKDFERMMGTGKQQSQQVVNYYAAPNQSLDAEQALFNAIKRAKVIAAW